MLDTIQLVCTNLQKHEQFLLSIVDLTRGAHVSRSDTDMTKIKTWVDFKHLEFHEERKTRLYYNGWNEVKSSHYNIYYSLNYINDCVTFNVSIPKFLYGNNIAQFVPHTTENQGDFSLMNETSRKELQRNTHKRLKLFIRRFLNYICPIYKFPLEDVRLTRLDLCYNQFFDTKQDALKYLEYQKMIRKSYIRDSTNIKHTYVDSVYIVTQDYTAKIYHKGNEFKRNDRKKLLAINKKYGRTVFKIESDENGEGMQSIADRCLRYEIEFRNGLLSDIYRKNYLWSDSKEWNRTKQLYKKYRSDEQIKDRLFKKYHDMKKVEKEINIDNFKELKTKLTKGEIALARYYQRVSSQSVEFFLNENNEMKRNKDFPGVILKENYIAPKKYVFPDVLLKQMFKIFNRFVAEFQVKEALQFSTASEKIVNYNNQVHYHNKNFPEFGKQKKMNLNVWKQKLLLLETYSLDDMVRLNLVNRQMAWRIKKHLEKIGWDKRNVAKLEIKTSTDMLIYRLITNQQNCPLSLLNPFFP